MQLPTPKTIRRVEKTSLAPNGLRWALEMPGILIRARPDEACTLIATPASEPAAGISVDQRKTQATRRETASTYSAVRNIGDRWGLEE